MIEKLNIHVGHSSPARSSDFNATTSKVDEVIEETNSHFITIEQLKADVRTKPNRDEFRTVHNMSVIGSGNIDTTPDSMTDEDIKEIFNTLV